MSTVAVKTKREPEVLGDLNTVQGSKVSASIQTSHCHKTLKQQKPHLLPPADITSEMYFSSVN